MTIHSTCDAPRLEPHGTPAGGIVAETCAVEVDVDEAGGWQALALAELRRPLTPAESVLTRTLPVEDALDRLFPRLSDAARHEALWALG
jgi:hypothetical protein